MAGGGRGGEGWEATGFFMSTGMDGRWGQGTGLGVGDCTMLAERERGSCMFRRALVRRLTGTWKPAHLPKIALSFLS